MYFGIYDLISSSTFFPLFKQILLNHNIFNTMMMLSYVFCFATTFLVASSTATDERSNLRGLAYEQQDRFPGQGTDFEKFEDRACSRTRGGGVEWKDYYIPFGTRSYKKCMKECLASNDCTGWEFTYGFVADENERCRIWIGRVRRSRFRIPRTDCYKVSTPSVSPTQQCINKCKADDLTPKKERQCIKHCNNLFK